MMRAAQRPKSIGIVGFGAFGRLMARHLGERFNLYACDPEHRDHGRDETFGVTFADPARVAACEVVILATPVDRMAEALAAIRDHLRPGVLLMDVGSVKVLPAEILRAFAPDHVDIVCTHPLFGPQSASGGLKGLKIAVCPIRGGRAREVGAFLKLAFGLEVIFTTPEAHDREAAMVQGLTHLIAKVLVRMEPLPTRMTTASFELLMRAVDMVRDDKPSVFRAIQRDNPYAEEVRERFFRLADEVHAELEAET